MLQTSRGSGEEHLGIGLVVGRFVLQSENAGPARAGVRNVRFDQEAIALTAGRMPGAVDDIGPFGKEDYAAAPGIGGVDGCLNGRRCRRPRTR